MHLGRKRLPEISSLEYQSLRQELSQNERYVLQTLFLIFAAFSTAFITLFDKSLEIDLTLPAILIGLLYCNLQIAKTRLYNNARIAAYISLALEQHSIEWIGWENALQQYREHKYNNQYEKQKGTTTLFWPHIYRANVLFGFIAIIISIITTMSWIGRNATTSNIQFDWILIFDRILIVPKDWILIVPKITIIISCVFLGWLFYLNHSMKTKDLIHEEKCRWINAFKKDDGTCIASDKNLR